jgi:hypothetical protein
VPFSIIWVADKWTYVEMLFSAMGEIPIDKLGAPLGTKNGGHTMGVYGSLAREAVE